MTNFTVISSVDSFPHWDELLTVALTLADEFCIFFPDGAYDSENPLLIGKPEFTALPYLKAGRWPNVKNYSVYFGSLDDTIRKLFLEFNEQSFDKDSSYLWQYTLYKGGIELLNVQDFTVCLLDLDTELTTYLQSLKIDWRDD